MGKKKSNKGGEKKNDNTDDGGKKEVTVVLKVDLHCEGCASKLVKSVRCFEGVDKVKSDFEANKLTVKGKIDPAKLREMVEQQIKKKVELLSPSKPKKDKENDNENDDRQKPDKAGDGQEKKKKKNKENNKDQKKKDKPDEKKSNEPPLTTAVMKIHLHCRGCVEKIYKIVSKTKGYREIAFDRAKDLVTVKGSMDMKALAESLSKQTKKDVEIVPAKKEGGGQKKEKASGGDEQGKGGGEGQASAEGGGHRMDFLRDGFPYPFQDSFPNPNPYPNPHPYPYPNVYAPGYVVDQVHAHQMFSDENPNACSVM